MRSRRGTDRAPGRADQAARPSAPDERHEPFIREFVAHRRMLHAFLLSLVGDHALAEDIFQEVALVLWRKYDGFEPGTNFGAWARAVAYREVLSERRRRARAAGSGKALLLCEDAVMDRILAAYARADEDSRASDSDRLDALRRCLEGVGESGLEMLRMRYEERLPSRLIAERLRRTVGAVDVAVHRLRTRLADCVEARLVAEEAR